MANRKIIKLQILNASNPDRHYEPNVGMVEKIEWGSINGEMALVPVFHITYTDGGCREIRTSEWIVNYEKE